MIPLIYHPAYNITAFGIEKRYPFDGRKYGRIHDALIAGGIRRRESFVRPRAVGHRELLQVHGEAYLQSLRRPATLRAILEVPEIERLPAWFIDWRVLLPMRFATGGTMLACRLALERGIAINLGGGFHHAAANWGSGFCVYADAALGSAILHNEGLIERVLVIDLDAHQGNGTANVFQGWPWAAILDLYQETLFPRRKEPEDYPIPVPGGMEGREYLDLVREFVPKALDAVRPNLIIYNAGSDPYEGDLRAGFGLALQDLVERDLLVVGMARERKVPVAMVLSGGFSVDSWRIHAESIAEIVGRFG